MSSTERFELIFGEEAKRDVREIIRYITEELKAPAAARKLLGKLLHAAGNAVLFPHANPLYFPPDEEPLRREYRKISLEGYLIFYYVDEDKGWVVISRVICARRDLRRKLEEPEGPVEGGERP